MKNINDKILKPTQVTWYDMFFRSSTKNIVDISYFILGLQTKCLTKNTVYTGPGYRYTTWV